MKFKHVEAFCLMLYRDETTGEVEIIWNSRDGVVPFGILSRQGNKATHIDWGNDICCPMFIPNVGDRVFVSLTMEKAIEFRTKYVDEYWEKKTNGVAMKDCGYWDSKDDAIHELAKGDMGSGGAPVCVTVTEEMQKEFRQAQQDRWVLAGALGHSGGFLRTDMRYFEDAIKKVRG
jgi:hypothetical protein